MISNTEVKNGDLVRELVTGYEGVVVSRTEFLNGCIRVSIQARDLKDGKPVEPLHADVEQLSIIGNVEEEVFAPRPIGTGGDRTYPSRR